MSFYPTKEVELRQWAENLLTAISGQGVASYNLTASDLTALTSVVNNFSSAYDGAVIAEIARKVAVSSKTQAKKALTTRVSNINNKVQAGSVSNALKIEAGLPVRDTTPGARLPLMVTSLDATPVWNGNVNLKWPRSGNPTGILFTVFASHDLGASWSAVATTRKVRFVHADQVPGTTIWYRVQASNDDVFADFSPIAVIYPESEGGSLRVAA